jgi:hypothetical protein
MRLKDRHYIGNIRVLFGVGKVLAAAVIIVIVGACGGETTAPNVPTTIQLTPTANTPITAGGSVQFTTTVIDQRGMVMTGVVPTFSTNPTDLGSISASGLFRSNGKLGVLVVRASIATISATSTVTVSAGPVAKLLKVSGDSQAVRINTLLPAPLVVRATDAFDNWLAGVLVSWTIIVSPAPSPLITVTDATGRAAIGLDVGGTPQTFTVQALVEGTTTVPPVHFRITATP